MLMSHFFENKIQENRAVLSFIISIIVTVLLIVFTDVYLGGKLLMAVLIPSVLPSVIYNTINWVKQDGLVLWQLLVTPFMVLYYIALCIFPISAMFIILITWCIVAEVVWGYVKMYGKKTGFDKVFTKKVWR